MRGNRLRQSLEKEDSTINRLHFIPTHFSISNQALANLLCNARVFGVKIMPSKPIERLIARMERIELAVVV